MDLADPSNHDRLMNSLTWPTLLRIAREETGRLFAALPAPIRARALALPVVFEPRPSPGLVSDGLDPDLLGLFVGGDFTDAGHDPIPAEIFLFLSNILDEAEGDERKYRKEVRKTLLHELGHYLGLDEDELWERGLE